MTTTINTANINAISNLVNAIAAISGCTFAHIEFVGEEKLPKKLGLGVVTKRVTAQVQINYSYENAVNNRLEKQGDDRTFVAEPLPWGKWHTPNKIIEHKGEFYLRYYMFKGQSIETEWYVDGRPMTDTEKQAMLAYKQGLKKGSDRQAAEGLTENQVEPRCVKMSNITAFKCGAITYDTSLKVAI